MFEHTDLVPLILSYLDKGTRRWLCKKYYCDWSLPIPKIDKIFSLPTGNYKIEKKNLSIRSHAVHNGINLYSRYICMDIKLGNRQYYFEVDETHLSSKINRCISSVFHECNDQVSRLLFLDNIECIYFREIPVHR